MGENNELDAAADTLQKNNAAGLADGGVHVSRFPGEPGVKDGTNREERSSGGGGGGGTERPASCPPAGAASETQKG